MGRNGRLDRGGRGRRSPDPTERRKGAVGYVLIGGGGGRFEAAAPLGGVVVMLLSERVGHKLFRLCLC